MVRGCVWEKYWFVTTWKRWTCCTIVPTVHDKFDTVLLIRKIVYNSESQFCYGSPKKSASHCFHSYPSETFWFSRICNTNSARVQSVLCSSSWLHCALRYSIVFLYRISLYSVHTVYTLYSTVVHSRESGFSQCELMHEDWNRGKSKIDFNKNNVKNPSWKFRNIFMKARTLSSIFLNFSILSYWFLNIHLYRAFGSKLEQTVLFFYSERGFNGSLRN
jgi:hypothetical protein